MSVEQTTQLIQLILNSALMVAVGAVVWLGLMLRWVWLDSLRRLSGLEAPRDAGESWRDRRLGWNHSSARSMAGLRRSDRRLKRQHQTATLSLFTAHGGLLLLLSSTLLLSLRTLWQANWLIQLSLGTFVLGVGGLLIGLGLCLVDWALSDGRRSHRLDRRWSRSLSPTATSSLTLKRQLEPNLNHKVG
ncbi:MAG: hypothetical protein Fur0046_04450 [Cyanobacteria bacterium J069]|nr:MAG: hypothetical protein D6742_01490 [Cyanobacteria bacterium J069]